MGIGNSPVVEGACSGGLMSSLYQYLDKKNRIAIFFMRQIIYLLTITIINMRDLSKFSRFPNYFSRELIFSLFPRFILT